MHDLGVDDEEGWFTTGVINLLDDMSWWRCDVWEVPFAGDDEGSSWHFLCFSPVGFSKVVFGNFSIRDVDIWIYLAIE